MNADIRRAIAILSVALAMAVSGCATLVKGTTQQVTVATDPAGALCKLDRKGELVGVVNPTPGTVTVSKGWGDLRVNCAKDRYEESYEMISASFQAMTLGNVLLGGVIGIAVDAASGAMVEYPSSINFVLFPVEFASIEERDQIFGSRRDALVVEAERAKEQIRTRCTTGNCEYQFKPIEEARDAKLAELEERRKRAKLKSI